MNDNAKVMNATVRLYCCGNRCERFLDIELKECCDAEDVLSEARQEAEITNGWQWGLYCEDHQDRSEPYENDNDFDTGDFDPYSSRA